MTPLEEIVVASSIVNDDDVSRRGRSTESRNSTTASVQSNKRDFIKYPTHLQAPADSRNNNNKGDDDGTNALNTKTHRPRRGSLRILEKEEIPDISIKRIRSARTVLHKIWRPLIAVASTLSFTFAALLTGVVYKDVKLFNIQLWRWFVSLASVPSAYYGSTIMIDLLTLGVESSFTVIKHSLYYILGIRRSFRNFMSACLILTCYAAVIATDPQAHKNVSHQAYRVCNVGIRALVCLTIFSAINLVSAFLAKALSAKYHHETHFKKMHDALKNEYLLRLLCNEHQEPPQGNDRTRRRRGSTLIVEDLSIEEATTTDVLERKKDEPDILIKMHKLEKHIRTQNLSNGFSASILAAANDKTLEESTLSDAKQLGYFLYWHLCRDAERDYIISDDLHDHVSSKYIEEAFSMLDKNGNGKVTLEEVQESITLIYTARKNLAYTLRDAEDIVGRLKVIFRGLFHTLGFFVYLLIFELNVARIYLTFSSMVVVSSLIFAPSIRNVYESVVFLFLVHPFDVGDIVKLESGDLVNIDKMGLSSCQLTKKADNSKIWFPNSKLIGMPLTNISRSDNKSDKFEIYLDIGTPASTFESIRAVCAEHIADNPQDYKQKCTCFIVGSQEPMKILLSIGWQASFPQSETERFAKARHALYTVIAEKLAALEAAYSAPTVPKLEKLPETNMKTAATVVSQLLRPEFLKSHNK